MGYQGFWGMSVLALVLVGHGLFVLRKETSGKELVEIPAKVKLFFGVLGVLCAAAFVTGIVMILCGAAYETVYAAGLVTLGMGFVGNHQLRKFAPLLVKKEEQEEETDE